MKSYFYPQSTYTSIIAFSELFNDLTVRVFNEKNEIVGIKPVPVILSPKEKIAAILSTTPINDVDPQVDNYLPKISINMGGMQLDTARIRGKFEKRLLNIEYDLDTNRRSMQMDVQSIPYILNFEVIVWTKYLTDGMQLVEYLTSNFVPEAYVSFKERNFGLEHKSKVTLNSISPNFVYELGETERRVITWTLNFDMETVIFKPMEIAKEILCSTIYIEGVPCKRTQFPGDKVVSYEPVKNNYESINTSTTKTGLYHMDASESYDHMIKYWKHANEVMDTPFNEKCVINGCNEPVGERPTWNSELSISPCQPIKMLPCVSVDSSGNITNYWQDEVVGPDNIINIVSYRRIYDSRGIDISGPDIIDNVDYPQTCYPVYTTPITSTPITSIPPIITPPPTSIPPPPEVDPCIIPPNYNTIG